MWYLARVAWLFPVWAALAVLLVGWGLLVRRVLVRVGGGAFNGSLSAFQTLWLGYAGLLGCLLLASLAVAVDRVVLTIAWLPALAGFALERTAVVRRIRQVTRRPRIAIVLGGVVLVTVFACAWAASDEVIWYDTGLYHLQAVQWNTTHAAVPGLANLHARLGYDNSVHVFAALVDSLWRGMSVHATNGFLLAIVLVQWVVEIVMARTPRGRIRQAYCLVTLPLFLGKLWTPEVASLSTDLPLAVVGAVLVLELLTMPRGRGLLLGVLVLSLAAVATTTKLGGLAFFVVVAIAMLWRVRGHIRRAQLTVFAVPAFVLTAWTARNVIVSGWLVFPVFGKLGLPWAVRSKTAHEHLRWIESWARIRGKHPSEVLDHGFFHWFVVWFDAFRTSREVMLLLASVPLAIARFLRDAATSAVSRLGESAAIVACVVALLQWFVGAPDVRFGGFLFWLLPAVLLAPVLARSLRKPELRPIVFALVIALAGWNDGLSPRLGRPPSLFGRLPEPGAAATRVVPAGPETELLVPATGDQCWNAGLLCTPEPRHQMFRDPHDVGAGFEP